MTEALQFLAKHRSSGALLDANLLLVYAVGKFDRGRLSKFHHTRQYANDFELVEFLVENLRLIYTTPNVLTEVSNLGGKLNAEGFFQVLQSIVGVLQEEYCISNHAAATPLFTKLGLTDVGILLLAQKNILVLTDDWPLYRILRSKNVDAVNINHLRQLYWDGGLQI